MSFMEIYNISLLKKRDFRNLPVVNGNFYVQSKFAHKNRNNYILLMAYFSQKLSYSKDCLFVLKM